MKIWLEMMDDCWRRSREVRFKLPSVEAMVTPQAQTSLPSMEAHRIVAIQEAPSKDSPPPWAWENSGAINDCTSVAGRHIQIYPAHDSEFLSAGHNELNFDSKGHGEFSVRP